MNKGIFKFILSGALVVACAGVFSSCKDTDEDLKIEVESSLQSVKSDLQSQIDALKTQVANIKSCTCSGTTDCTCVSCSCDLEPIETAIAALETRVDTLEGDVAAIQEDILAIQEAIADLQAQIDEIAARLNVLVTSILVQSTYNYAFGSLSLPLGIQSNVLMAYYGDAVTAGVREFPTADDGKEYGNKTAAMLLTPGDALAAADEINLGTLYMTINPTNVDLTGTVLTLVNSQDAESAVKLAPIAASEKLLTFGYSRADNGFYEAEATLPVASIDEVKIGLDSQLKSVANDLVSNGVSSFSASTVASIVSGLYSQFNGFLPALGLKAEYSYEDENGEMQTAATYSNYNVAATAFEPLSYSFLAGHSLSTGISIPSISADSFEFSFDGVSVHFDINLDLSVDVDGIAIDPIDIELNINFDDELTAEVSFDYSYWVLDAPNRQEFDEKYGVDNWTYEVYKTSDGSENGYLVTVTVINNTTVDGVEALIDSIGDAVNEAVGEAVNDMIKDLTDEVNDVINNAVNNALASVQSQIEKMLSDMEANVNEQLNDVLQEIAGQINGKISSMLTSVNSYLDKLNTLISRVNGILSNPNYYLQSTIFYAGSNGGLHQMSTTKAAPVTFNMGSGDAISLYLTSYTAEVLVPAYKKYVTVTSAWKNDDSTRANVASVVSDANSKGYFNQTLPGNVNCVAFAPQAGYTYEIVYQALDYHGNTSTTVGYVTVK